MRAMVNGISVEGTPQEIAEYVSIREWGPKSPSDRRPFKEYLPFIGTPNVTVTDFVTATKPTITYATGEE